MISVAREKAFLSNKAQAVQKKNLPEQASFLVPVIVREVSPPEISEVSRSLTPTLLAIEKAAGPM